MKAKRGGNETEGFGKGAYTEQLEIQIRKQLEEEKEQLKHEKLDKKVRGPLLKRLHKEYSLAPVASEGNNELSENVIVKQEDFIDGDINDVQHKLELDSDCSGSPQSKKLKTYHEYKTFLSSCQVEVGHLSNLHVLVPVQVLVQVVAICVVLKAE